MKTSGYVVVQGPGYHHSVRWQGRQVSVHETKADAQMAAARYEAEDREVEAALGDEWDGLVDARCCRTWRVDPMAAIGPCGYCGKVPVIVDDHPLDTQGIYDVN